MTKNELQSPIPMREPDMAAVGLTPDTTGGTADTIWIGRNDGPPSRVEMLNALDLKQGTMARKNFASATVAICGLGGLGSNIAICLARGGIGRLILIDFDRVDITNLHRQQYKANQVGMLKADALKDNLLEIAPYTQLETHAVRITEANYYQLLKDADVICEAFDSAEAKAMLVNTVLENMPEKFLVAASGMAGFASANLIHTRRLGRRFYLCGDGVSDVGNGVGLLPSRVMLCAAHEAHTVFRILTEEFSE